MPDQPDTRRTRVRLANECSECHLPTEVCECPLWTPGKQWEQRRLDGSVGDLLPLRQRSLFD